MPPVEFQYYDDGSASTPALQSGRADLTFDPNATSIYKAATDGKTMLAGLVDGGWPLQASIVATNQMGNGLAAESAGGLDCYARRREVAFSQKVRLPPSCSP